MAPNVLPVSRFCFDITEVVRYAKRHERVTGIQRVELNVIRECIRLLGPDGVCGLIREEGGQGVRRVNLGFLADDSAFVASRLLQNTGALNTGIWPDKLILRKHLDSLRHRKVLRVLKKLRIYLMALIARRKLIEQGLLGALKAVPYVSACAALRPDDVYIALGTGWEDPHAFRIAREHHKRGGKVVQMVHDLIPIVRPDLHMPAVSARFGQWLDQAATCVTLFLTVSQHTAKDLRGFLTRQGRNIPIAVTPLAHEFTGYARGAAVDLPPGACEAVAQLATRRFVLCVGSLEGRKNIARLLSAWSQARNTTGDTQTLLVFAGRRGWMIDTFDAEMRKTNAAGGSALVIENATDAELAWLYSHSQFTVYPSLYEGWGLPVGESLWFGTPCLASTASSVPEVGGSLVTYVSPDHEEAMARQLGHFLAEPQALQLARTQIGRASLRTWVDHATDVTRAISEHTGVNGVVRRGVQP
jgi:glycosyltransferase involved in cell wall biosynthesis